MLKRTLSLCCLAVALLAFVGAAPVQDHEAVTHTGEIAEKACFNEGRMGPDHAGCAKSCFNRGADMGLVVGDPGSLELIILRPNPDDDSAYESLKELAGHAATVTGYMAMDDDDHQVLVVTAAEAATD